MILALLAVGDDRRAGRLEPLDGVADRVFVQRFEAPDPLPSDAGDGVDQLAAASGCCRSARSGSSLTRIVRPADGKENAKAAFSKQSGNAAAIPAGYRTITTSPSDTVPVAAKIGPPGRGARRDRQHVGARARPDHRRWRSRSRQCPGSPAFVPTAVKSTRQPRSDGDIVGDDVGAREPHPGRRVVEVELDRARRSVVAQREGGCGRATAADFDPGRRCTRPRRWRSSQRPGVATDHDQRCYASLCSSRVSNSSGASTRPSMSTRCGRRPAPRASPSSCCSQYRNDWKRSRY